MDEIIEEEVTEETETEVSEEPETEETETEEPEVSEESEEPELSDYARRKRANDYALIVNAYPWAKDLGASVESFGDLFMETMAVNEERMDALTAFELAYRREIAAKSRESIRRNERRKMENKAHLTVKGAGNGGSSVTVPKDVLKMYKTFNPSLSELEIRKAYAKEINEN